MNAENLTLGIRAFSLNYEITDMILMANNITFHDSPFTYCKGIKRLYVNPNATVSYDGQYLNSAEGDVFEELESLAEVILPGDCGFLSENSFVGTPKATIYAPSGSSTIQSANELWIPTNSDKFDDKLASVKEQLINLGYESIIEEQTTVEEQNTNEKISSTENRTSEVIFNDSETIKWVQEELNSLGYGCGTPDGIAGEKTQNAIRNYKTNNGMHDDCEITQELLDSFANNQPTTGYANSEIHEIISSGLKNLATENFEISGPVTQEDNGTVAYGYNLLYNKVKAMMIVNPDFEGRVKVGFIPVSISNDTSSAKDFFNLVAYTIQSLDDSISYDSAFNTVDTACIDGKNEINGILCEYSAPNFFVTY